MKKIFSFILLLFIFFIFSVYVFKNKLRIYHKLPNDVKSVILILSGKAQFSNLKNDYNEVFLPKTQFVDFNFFIKKIKIDDLDKKNYFYHIINKDYKPLYTFYIEKFQGEIFIVSKKGKIYKSKIENFEEQLDLKTIENNLNVIKVLDTLVINNTIYISAVTNKDGCKKIEILYSTIKQKFNFQSLKKFDECGENAILGGRMQEFNFKNQNGILISTANILQDNPDKRPQEKDSIFGKILFINLNNKKHFIFSFGHRNVQGLLTNKNLVIATEHGPKGGDELNKIFFNKNYGWPISSYGKSYKNKNLKYFKSHKEHGFEEPIYSFVPSIGISEIIEVPENFDENWKNSILVTSLNGKSIYRLKFETDNFDKLIYIEKIFVGKRIRDIKYLEKNNIFILALESFGEIGILQKK